MRHQRLLHAAYPTLLAISTGIVATLACSPAMAQNQDGTTPPMQTSPDPEPYCFGVWCPCGNDAPATGCANSSGRGVMLQAFGSTSVAADDLSMYISYPSHFGPSSPWQMFMGETRASVPFGDGLLCVGAGATGLVRVEVSSYGGIFGGSVDNLYWLGVIGATEEILPGSTWCFQVWYRDLGGPCGANFNFTNALRVQFAP